jgi:EmrB/QacA subfamily drug resistance transporter
VSAPAARAVPVRRRVEPRTVLLVASLGAALAFVDATIVNVAFPDIRESFPDASLSHISWVLNAYNIVFAAFLLPGGRIADLLGRKRLFEWGIALFVVASVLCALAPSIGLLIAFRVLQALGAAVLVPTSLALVLQAYPAGSERTHAVALWSASAALGAGLGPALGGVLVELGGWRLAFVVNLPLGLAALWAARRTLVESRAPGRRALPDALGALLLAAGMSLLTLAIVQGDTWGWASAETLVCALAGLALLALFLRRSLRHPAPIVDLGLLRIRSVAVANVLTVVGAAGFYAYVLCNILYLTEVWDYTVLQAGLAITPGPFIAAAVARPASRLAARAGSGPVVFAGALIWGAGVWWLITRVGLQPAYLEEWLPVMVLLGIGAGITFPVVGSASVAAVPGGRFATATGLNSVTRQFGAVLGVALLVAIVGRPAPAEVADAFDRGWTFALVCFLVVAFGGLALGRVQPAEDAAEPEPAGPTDVPLLAGAAPVAAAPPAPAVRADLPPAELLGTLPLFAHLKRKDLERLAERSSERELLADDVLFEEGDPAGSVFVIVAGRVEIVKAGEVIRILGPGEVVGELALITASTRSAAIRARRDSRVLELRREDVEALLDERPGFARALLRVTGLQLARSRVLDPGRPAPATTIALVMADPALPAERIAEVLARELGAAGAVARLDGPSSDGTSREVEVLERAEAASAHVLLVAGDPHADWARFAARHADRTLVATGPGPVPGWVGERPELRHADVLVVAADAAPAVALWLDALEPRGRHVADPADLEAGLARAARRLGRRSIGLVLSGGGARGMAHIGVLDELAAAGVVIDRVGGCSFGGFLAALVAAGCTPDEIDAICYEEWVRRRPLGDYRLPRRSLIAGDRVRAMLDRTLPRRAEGLPLDFYCVASDLRSSELVVLRRGPLTEIVAAGMGLPGLAPPVALGDRLLVDGAVLNNLPVDPMISADEGPVIAVDASARFDAARDGEDLGIVEVLTRSVMLGSADQVATARERADLLIEPDNRDGVGLLEFHQLDAMRAAGRRAARAALARLDGPLI